MRSLLTLLLGLLLTSTLVADTASSSAAAIPPTVDYQQRIKPLLQARCVACHGGLKQEGGLRLDSGRGILAGGDNGAAIEVGASDASELIDRIISDDEWTRMPQEGPPLTEEEIQWLRRWIDDGADHPADEAEPQDPLEHWSFVLPVRPTLPAAARSGGLADSKHPIDRLLTAEQTKRGLEAVPLADKHTPIRQCA